MTSESSGRRSFLSHADIGTSRGFRQPVSCFFPKLPQISSLYFTKLMSRCLRERRCVSALFSNQRLPVCSRIPHSESRAAKVHRWLDKSFIVSLAARACGFILLFRKVVPFSSSFGCKSIKFGRPSYSHVLCFAKDRTCSVSKGAWADVSARGSMV
jgi:hypothetical protein